MIDKSQRFERIGGVQDPLALPDRSHGVAQLFGKCPQEIRGSSTQPSFPLFIAAGMHGQTGAHVRASRAIFECLAVSGRPSYPSPVTHQNVAIGTKPVATDQSGSASCRERVMQYV